jgi:hypothetical protein
VSNCIERKGPERVRRISAALAHRSNGTDRPIVWLHGASGPKWSVVAESLVGEYRHLVHANRPQNSPRR